MKANKTLTLIEELNLPLISLKDSTSTKMIRAKNSLTMLIYTIHDFWRRFDDTYMRPVFGGPPLYGYSSIILV
ncbi:Sodium/hydrogen exchanger [Thalictrum thalictroides]|uniref:Sodium/hydrogen exchanger n=1 Tax=Thalictrum thalictroides TaxID=46969 RepID=A0A7J6WIK0_THATH|nr:Sodium/hydrogen exchanger [Thalictrum thalictroides]